MPGPIDVESPPKDLQKLLLDATPELEAFDPARMVHRLASRRRVLELSNIVLISMAPLVEQLEKELSPARYEQHMAELERLDARAWIYYAADLAAEELHSNTAKKQRKQLAKAVAEHDRFLLKWATPLFGDHPEHGPMLRDISRGTGLRDDAEDVLRLVSLFRDNWALAKTLGTVSEERLEQAAADAAQQLDNLRNGVSNPGRKRADAGYSLWFYDYDELMHLGRYLCRREPDVIARFPGVRELAIRSDNSSDADEEPEAESADADENLQQG